MTRCETTPSHPQNKIIRRLSMCLEKMLYSDIRNLAYRFYKERGQSDGFDQEDWFTAKKVIYRRIAAGFIYFCIGGYLVHLLIKYFLGFYGIIEILWCIGWSMVGVGAGLINTRNHPQSSLLHLLGYWGFVLLTVSIAAFTISLYISGENYFSIKFYALSALLGLVFGFLGNIFRDLALGVINKNSKY
jgi:hypothetical protein